MQNIARLLIVVTGIALGACKPRAADQSLVREDGQSGDANLAALLSTLDATLDEVEAGSDAQGTLRQAAGASLDDTADATPESIMALARELEQLTANDTVADRARARELVIKLQTLSNSVAGGRLTAEQRAAVEGITTRVRILIARRSGTDGPAPQQPAAERPPQPADRPGKRTVDGKVLECVIHPQGNVQNKRNWAVKVDGRLIDHRNGFHEMMTEAACHDALKHVKNGVICAGRCADCGWANSNGLYRLSDARSIGDSTGFSNES